VGAALPETVLARRRSLRPDRRILGDVGKVRSVAGRADVREPLDLPELRGLLAGVETAFGPGAPQTVKANIVRATLEKRGARAGSKRLPHRRQVAVEELILQRLGAGRDDHLAAGE